ncbi:MAG TPA: RecX family transcriptional regulator [Thermomicrobiales bacterium]|nr:RecX family transcriptional regulator [Thermomicrobiales bacterium]
MTPRGSQRSPQPRPAPEPRAGQITRLSPQTHDPDRLNVELDGEFAFGIGAELAEATGLAAGMNLTVEQVKELLARDQVGKAIEAAIRLLTRRPRSEREIRQRLRQKGFDAPAIDAAIARLEDWRYLDDADFARFWVENRESHKPRGRRLLEQELRQKGIDRDLITETIDAAELDERAAALDLGRAKLRTYGGLDTMTTRRRLGSYLARRGYDFSVVRATLDQLLGEDDVADE